MARIHQRRTTIPSVLRRVHPSVRTWLEQRATQRHQGDTAAAAAQLIERAYMHAHPERGPCASCGKATSYAAPDRRCPACTLGEKGGGR